MVGVARGHQRADTLKPFSQKTSQSNHTRPTAFSNSMKLSHACGATQDGRVIVERSDGMWSTGEGNSKPLQYSCLDNPMQEYWNGLPFPSPVDHILSDLSTMTRPSWVAPQAWLLKMNIYKYIFIQFIVFLKQEYWNGLPFPFAVEHICQNWERSTSRLYIVTLLT